MGNDTLGPPGLSCDILYRGLGGVGELLLIF